MPKYLDITGDRYGRLLAIKTVGISHDGRTLWKLKCDCGNFITVPISAVRSGNTKSCGCLQVDSLLKWCRKHGESNLNRTPEYVAWKAMKRRCRKEDKDREYYFDRKIRVCKRWLNSFENFLKDMGRKPTPKHTLDRINNNKGYSPSNCRWATYSEQALNRRKKSY